MPMKSRTDVKKAEAERLQAMVIELLREEENKYCADCEAKQPRWASWNLGVFLCIRCAGIHRNLGVHLTKVKSVNLDSWTPEQVQSMRVMGNKMARRVYEAELPEHFRRPQTDSALESFIRAKYEHKRYILKDWSPPAIDVNDLPPPPDKRHHSDRGVRLNVKKGDSHWDAVEKTRTTAGKDGADLVGGTVADVPLLDLTTPSLNPENTLSQPFAATVDKRPMHLNSTIVEDDGMEDFGPIVCAPPANPPSDIFATDAVASSSNGKSGIINSSSENNLEDLASVLGANCTVNEKKSNSDILALYGNAPKFYARSTKHECGMQQFPEVSSGDDKALGKVDKIPHLSDAASNVGTVFGPPVVPLAQPSYGPNVSQSGFAQIAAFGSGANTLPAGNFFLNRETAAAFAAASPFANAPVATTTNAAFPSSQAAFMDIPCRTAPAKEAFASLSKAQPQTGDNRGYMDIFSSTAEESKNHFIADFSQLNMNMGGESREQNTLQTNISWN